MHFALCEVHSPRVPIHGTLCCYIHLMDGVKIKSVSQSVSKANFTKERQKTKASNLPAFSHFDFESHTPHGLQTLRRYCWRNVWDMHNVAERRWRHVHRGVFMHMQM